MLVLIPGCHLAELAYSFHSKKNEKKRAVSNFLFSSHGWNLFTTQRGFVVTGSLQNLLPRPDFCYSCQNGKLFFLFDFRELYTICNTFPKSRMIGLIRWNEEYFGILHHESQEHSVLYCFMCYNRKSVTLLKCFLSFLAPPHHPLNWWAPVQV